ncbi:MAG: hypothetical protein NTZ51_07230 [Proteobacteria bacterium]|nr:hypothetical protein [Pseudomonadota bacterium]
MKSPMRLDPALVTAAEQIGLIYKRSVPKQIEFWAELGKSVERLIDITDIISITQGFKRIKVEPEISVTVDPSEVFKSLENSRKSGALAKKVTSATVYYEASLSQPGFLDRVNSTTGERQTGQFHNGEFKVHK